MNRRKITWWILPIVLIGLLSGCSKTLPAEESDDFYALGEEGPEIQITELPSQQVIEGFTPVTENSGLVLYVNKATTAIAVLDEKSGEVWYSNPPDAAADPLATPVIKEDMQSQVTVSYYDRNNIENSLTNYSSTQEYGRYGIRNIENGVEVSYVLGNFKPPLFVPSTMTAERYEFFYNKLTSEDEKAEMKKRYRKVSLEILTDPNEKAMMLRRYPTIRTSDIYVKYEMKDYVAQRLAGILASVGYTQADYESDNMLDTEIVLSSKIRIALTVQYRIEDGSFIVNVPVGKIKCKNQYRLYSVSVLNMFGAAGGQDKGYMFVPDGSGALIRLNNGKINTTIYSTTVYSEDRSKNEAEGINPVMTASMPVFGMKKGDNGFLAIIEGADAVAKIKADISGKQNSYNIIYPEFIVRDNVLSDLGNIAGDLSMRVYQPTAISQDIQVNYRFLHGEESTYSGMARYYRSYLKERDELKVNEMTDQLPMLVDIYGAVQKNKNVMGVPMQAYVPLTSFAQAQAMLEDLNGSGVQNLDARYIGWYNKGVKNVNPADIRLIPQMGGKGSLDSLLEYANLNDISMFMNLNLLYLNQDTTFDRINLKNDTIHFMDRSTGYVYGKNWINMRNNLDKSKCFILSPGSMMSLFSRFDGDFSRKAAGADLSFQLMNSDVNSDFNLDRTIDRTETTGKYQEVYQSAVDKGYTLLMDGANKYGYAYADGIVKVPYFSNNFRITDGSVPFIQMILSGSIAYYGTPINTGADFSTDLLHIAETGSGLYAVLTHDYDQDITTAGFDYLYSVRYSVWKDNLTSSYQQLNKDLQGVAGVIISDHYILDEGITLTVYENGKAVLVNYTEETIDTGELQSRNTALTVQLPPLTVAPGTYAVITTQPKTVS
ncbi:MAG: DUF5696 domain-containing protein [Saccharofermentanales bacterium]